MNRRQMLYAPLAALKRFLKLEGTPLFNYTEAEYLEALLVSRRRKPGPDKQEIRWGLVDYIKSFGPHHYASKLLAEHKEVINGDVSEPRKLAEAFAGPRP